MKNLFFTLLLATSFVFASSETSLKLNSDVNFALSKNSIELTFNNNINVTSMSLINLSSNEVTTFPFVNQYNSLSIDLANYTYGGYVLSIENDNYFNKIMLYLDEKGLRLIDDQKVFKPIFQQRKNNLLIKILNSESTIDVSIISDRGYEIFSDNLVLSDLNKKVFNFKYDINSVTVNLRYDDKTFKKKINF
tara:strand:- start:205 stop:780 length:576 start_codon:yes stop_codon:yes gene_type:complete